MYNLSLYKTFINTYRKILSEFKYKFGSRSRYSSRTYKGYSIDDIKILLRNINLEIILGNLDITPDIKRLNEKTIRECRNLTNKGMTIGGSILLKACGLLDRETVDIDVFWDINKAIESNMINKDNIINSSRDYGGTLIRYKIQDPDFGELDIFQLNDDRDNNNNNNNNNNIIDEYLIDGIRFKDPISTLDIKFKYFREKDAIDFWYIKDKFGI